jgi:hypothetical protein
LSYRPGRRSPSVAHRPVQHPSAGGKQAAVDGSTVDRPQRRRYRPTPGSWEGRAASDDDPADLRGGQARPDREAAAGRALVPFRDWALPSRRSRATPSVACGRAEIPWAWSAAEACRPKCWRSSEIRSRKAALARDWRRRGSGRGGSGQDRRQRRRASARPCAARRPAVEPTRPRCPRGRRCRRR